MKKVILFTLLLFVGSILVVQLARYSSRSTAIIFEWVALISCMAFVALCVWVGSRYLYRRRNQDKIYSKPSSEVAAELGITKRELEVLSLAADGLSNRQIFEKLFISESTVKKHVSNVFGKLNASWRTEAIKIAYKTNLIPLKIEH